MFETLQDRLVKELALAGITTVAAASRLIQDCYLPLHNAQSAVTAEQEGSAFVALGGVDLREILCFQEERQVERDNTVSWRRMKLQIPPSPLRAHFVKARVNKRELIRDLRKRGHVAPHHQSMGLPDLPPEAAAALSLRRGTERKRADN